VKSLSLQPNTGAAINSSHAITSIDNLISTAFVSGLGWLSFDGNSPMGKWTVTLDNTTGEGINRMITEGRLRDIIFVIDYSADLPTYNLF
jgi:hypothetical protein